METAARIVTLFGGVTKLAAAIDATPQRVANWRARRSIPKNQIPAILGAAKKSGLKLDYADFFEDPT